MTKHVKVLFPFTDSEGNYEIESMWALKKDDGYEIDNIPFYVTEVACGDVVSAKPDADGMLVYSGLVRPSRHSTIHILVTDERDKPSVRDELKKMGCGSEGSDIPVLVAVDVPPTVPYEKIKAYLDENERAGRFEYREACLGFL